MNIKQLVTLISLLFSTTNLLASPTVDIKWLGGPTMVIKFNGTTFLTDPMLGEGKHAFLMGDPNEMFDLTKGPNIKNHARITPLPTVDLSGVNFILLSHAHEDHFDQKAHQLLDKNIQILLPHDDESKVRQLGFNQLNLLHVGQTVEIDTADGHITITTIPADHSTNLSLTPLLGEGLGYVIEFSLGNWHKTIYWTGDSMPTERVIRAASQKGPFDVLIPNMGAVGTTGPLGQISMGATDVIKLATALKINKVFPIHHSTYELYIEPIEKLQQLAKGSKLKLTVLSEGESINL